MKQLIRPYGRHHQIPRCFNNLFGDLETMPGIDCVGGGRFIRRDRARKFSTHIQHYNESSRTLRVRVEGRGFIQYVGLVVYPGHREEVEDYIRNYRFNHR